MVVFPYYEYFCVAILARMDTGQHCSFNNEAFLIQPCFGRNHCVDR